MYVVGNYKNLSGFLKEIDCYLVVDFSSNMCSFAEHLVFIL